MKKSKAIIASCLLLVLGAALPAAAKTNESPAAIRIIGIARQSIRSAMSSLQLEKTRYLSLVKQMNTLNNHTKNIQNAMATGKKMITFDTSRVNASMKLVESDIRFVTKASSTKKLQNLQHDIVQLNQSIHLVDTQFLKWVHSVQSLIVAQTTVPPAPPSSNGTASGNSADSTGVQPPPPPPAPPSVP